MTTDHHTPIATGAPANAGVINVPLGQLDAAIGPSSYPMFRACITTTHDDVTGDGTYYTVVFDEELLDQDSGYNDTTGVFTAPVAGKYIFTAHVTMTDLDSGHTNCSIFLVTTDLTYISGYCHPYTTSQAGVKSVTICVVVDMDVSDTAYIQIRIDGGTKTVDAYGNAVVFIAGSSCFSGGLLA